MTSAASASMPPDIYLERLVFSLPEPRFPRPVANLLRAFFGPDAEPHDALINYLRLVLPEGAPTTLYVANVSRENNPQENHRNLLFRPPCEGPRTGDYGRGNHTLAFSTYRKQGRLVVASLEVTPHVPLRGFEARVSAPVYWTGADDLYMSREDFDALGGLPAHRLRTIARLSPWRRYLTWKEDLIRRSQIEIPYIAYHRVNDTCFAFLVCEQHLPERSLAQVEFDVTDPRTASADELEPDDLDDTPRRPGKRPPDPIRLGIFDRKDRVDPRQSHPWGKAAGPGQVQVVLRVDEDQARKLDGRELPRRGRLLSSIAGELMPLRLQTSGISRLESSQGFCPRLVDFLFDARNASAPVEPGPLPPLDGGRPLNDGQQEAVRKALAAPDLCLIQGPPGTGKTTVIAEICLRMAMQGGRVLVASQTNLAVDNALSRLADRPAVRRLRLGAADKVDEEFKDFLAENVISRWFRTIADQCHRRIDAADALRGEREARRHRLADLRALLEAHAHAERTLLAEKAHAHALTAQHDTAMEAHVQARRAAETARIDATRARALADWTAGGPFPTIPLGDGAPGHSAEHLAGLATASARHAPLERLAEILAEIRLDATAGESSPEISDLRRRQRVLAESEHDEDLAELKQVNRRLKKLEEDGWLATGRGLRQAAAEAFPAGSPASIDALRDALKPSDALAEPLAQAIRTVRAQLETAADAHACVEALAQPFADRAHTAAQAHTDARAAEARHASDLATLADSLASAQDAATRAAVALADAVARWEAIAHDLDVADAAPAPAKDALQHAAAHVAELDAGCAERLARADRWRSIQTEWLARLQGITEADRDHLRDLYIRHANVVGMTCNEAGKPQHFQSPEWRPFDLVIIDEVSKATPTELLMPMLLGERVVLVGDHRQLPPMFRENRDSFADAIENGELEAAEFDEYRRMVTASLFEELYDAAPAAIKATLWTQYRMHPQVMQAVNQFYENRLLAGPDEQALDQARQHHLHLLDRDGGRFLEPGQHLLWVDSSEHQGVRRTEEQRGTSKYNTLEVDLVLATLATLARGLLRRGYVGVREHTLGDADAGRSVSDLVDRLLRGAPVETVRELFDERRIRLDGRHQRPDSIGQAGSVLRIDARKDVGVLTFYFAQLKGIREAIDAARGRDPSIFDPLDLRTNTVDRFQGMEKAIVIASLVRSTAGNLGQFVREYQRINVGLSRAQQLLVIIGAATTWKRARVPLPPLAGGEPEHRAVYQDIVEIANRHGGRRFARQLVT